MPTNPAHQHIEPYSLALLDAVIAGTPRWIGERVRQVALASLGTAPHGFDEVIAIIEMQTLEEVTAGLVRLLETDVDAQSSNPLHILRSCTHFATETLRRLGVAPVTRDEFETRAMPNDVYALGPLTWRDLGDDVHDAGITWGAWKAATILTRRRAEGKLDQ